MYCHKCLLNNYVVYMCWQIIKRQLLHVGSEGWCDHGMVYKTKNTKECNHLLLFGLSYLCSSLHHNRTAVGLGNCISVTLKKQAVCKLSYFIKLVSCYT